MYKKSVYEIYFVRRLQWSPNQKSVVDNNLIKHFELSHESHYETLRHVQSVIEENKIPYCTIDRKRPIDYKDYDLVISVGGDGTFLTAASHVSNQIILGVNSNPDVSVGRFCSSNKDNFQIVFDSILKRKPVVRKLNRIELFLNGHSTNHFALNDFLICHRNPAAMSHYALTIGNQSEYQRSSGMWISTAAGSTGAIQSASGTSTPLHSTKIQYQPRELYWKFGQEYRLTGGLVSGKSGISMESKMEDGMIYIDGSRVTLPFCHGDFLETQNAPTPLNVVDYKSFLSASHLKRQKRIK